ncbi:hypothetical protein [Actinomadura sp. 21ATH]|uniref:hypothetical protein n=1 Tax=Actinomadura sp. 21ATH TaxID=1735444 RepID=UPI0035C25A78
MSQRPPAEPVTRAQYQLALHQANERRANRGDKATHWGVVHSILTKHAPPPEGNTDCRGCGNHWPCATINGAVKDVSMGDAGW